jgi:hypothetical protein
MAGEAGRLAVMGFVVTPLSWRSGARDNDCLGISPDSFISFFIASE